MKVGIFTDQFYPYISGVVTSIKMLYEGLTDLGHEVYVFSSIDEEKVASCEELKNFNFVNLPGKPYPFKDLKDYRYIKKPKKLIPILKPYQLDIIHVHTEFNIAKIARVIGKTLNIPIVHTLHTLYEDYLRYVSPFFDKHVHNIMFKTLAKMFVRKISRASTIEIVPTRKVLSLSKRYYMEGDIRVIPTGIELDRFSPEKFTQEEKDSLKEKLGIPKDKFVFGYIGRTSAEKGIDMIIRAFSRLKNHNNSILFIVGGGPQLESLKNLAEYHNILDSVLFTGFIENDHIPIYYQICDIFVNASKSETQGLTYIESLASALPLLVQKDDCIEDVIEDYYNGIYFDGEEDLVTKMEEIQKVPSTLKNIKANTMKSCIKFSKEHYAKSVEALYKDAITIYNNKRKK